MSKIINNFDTNKGFFNNLKKVISGTSVSRFFGLVRDISTTNLFGASVFHDIFIICLKIPNLFRRFFAEGAFNQAFVPLYAEYQEKKDDLQTREFLNAISGTLIFTLFIFTLVVLTFAPIFIFLFAPGFYFDPIKQDISVQVLRIMFPYLALISLVALAGGIQNTHQKFSLPALTPVIFNLSLIVAALFIAPKYDMPIYVLAWSVLLAGLLQLVIQIAPLRSIKRLPTPKINFKNKGIKKFFVVIFPAILAGGIIQINLLVDTIFASLLETGSPTWLYVSDRLVQFPLGIFAIAIGTVLLPTLSKLDVIKERAAFNNTIKKGQKFVLFIGIPSLIGLMFCAEDLISTIFYRGAFTEEDVSKSSLSLIAFSIGLPFFMLMKVLVPAFFSRQDTKTPMYAAIAALISNIILNYIFVFILGYDHAGLALASSISASLSCGILFLILVNGKYIQLQNPFNRFNLSILTASIIVGIFLIYGPFNIDFNSLSFTERLLTLLLEVGFSILLYLGITRVVIGKSLRSLF